MRTFARIYEKKLGINQETMMKKLWGDNYFDPETNKWTTEPFSESGKQLKRGFVQFIMDPICELSRAIMAKDTETYEKLIKNLNLTLTQEDRKAQ